MKVTLAIRSYTSDAVVDHYADGRFENFDAATAEVIDGPMAGRILQILVASGSHAAPRWNRPGGTLAASVDPVDLDTQVLYAGAFRLEDAS